MALQVVLLCLLVFIVVTLVTRAGGTTRRISPRAAEETLREAERVTRKGITINTFMLDSSPLLRGFVDEMTRINKGRAFFTTPDHLGEYILVDYVANKRKQMAS